MGIRYQFFGRRVDLDLATVKDYCISARGYDMREDIRARLFFVSPGPGSDIDGDTTVWRFKVEFKFYRLCGVYCFGKNDVLAAFSWRVYRNWGS